MATYKPSERIIVNLSGSGHIAPACCLHFGHLFKREQFSSRHNWISYLSFQIEIDISCAVNCERPDLVFRQA